MTQTLPLTGRDLFWPPADELTEAAERIRARLGEWPPTHAPPIMATPSSSVVSETAWISASASQSSIRRLCPASGTYATCRTSAALKCSKIVSGQLTDMMTSFGRLMKTDSRRA